MTIQVGDFGAGFAEIPELAPKHKFIRGNHDNPAICKAHLNWIPDGAFWGKESMYFLGGGLSIDRANRVLGETYWDDEELTFGELYQEITRFEILKPRIVVSHCAPHEIGIKLFPTNTKRYFDSRTANAFDAMLAVHKPEMWIFGHYHQTVRQVIDVTTFMCLGELHSLNLEV
jgi:predicted phosphohydrolase